MIAECLLLFGYLFIFMLLVPFVQVFVDHPSYHRPGNLYGDNFGAFGDNQVKKVVILISYLIRWKLYHINWLTALYHAVQIHTPLLCCMWGPINPWVGRIYLWSELHVCCERLACQPCASVCCGSESLHLHSLTLKLSFAVCTPCYIILLLCFCQLPCLFLNCIHAYGV